MEGLHLRLHIAPSLSQKEGGATAVIIVMDFLLHYCDSYASKKQERVLDVELAKPGKSSVSPDYHRKEFRILRR